MKKIIFLILFFGILINQVQGAGPIFSKCERYYESMNQYSSLYNLTDNSDEKKSYYASYLSYKKKYEECEDENSDKLNGYIKSAEKAYDKEDYLNAVGYYKLALQLQPNDEDIENNLGVSYFKLGNLEFENGEYESAIANFKEYINIFGKDYSASFNIGLCYFNIENYNQAEYYFKEAGKLTNNSSEKETVNGFLSDISISKLQKNAPTNDPLSGFQYYLRDLNIVKAWDKVQDVSYIPVIAIIDDGININHPDLTDSIWIHSEAKYGDSKIIDFVGDKIQANTPTGDHGTMIAGIIGATQNNKEGISGIAKKVEIMPLRVFDFSGNAEEENVIKAIQYAIDNGANIINLSLGGNQFEYSDKFDEVIKNAYTKGIPIIIAAGNGDLLTEQSWGVNLSINPIAPVCNNQGSNEYSIGVSASDENGNITQWTNYGDCAPIIAPGVGIISTSIPVYNSEYGLNYSVKDGTSFSAPMISGIVALGFNKFGKLPPSVIYKAINGSLVKNKAGNYIIDADKYIQQLEKYNKLSDKAKAISKKLKTLPQNKIIKYINVLKKAASKLSGDKKVLIELIIKQLEEK